MGNSQPSGHGKLKTRHITMIAIGGVIGAGLFVGSSATIAEAGPAIVLTYAFTGLLVMGVMRLLGEMLLAQPGKGTFIDYIRCGCGRAMGFTAGWLYALFWITAIGEEAIAGAIILQPYTGLPIWILATLLVLAVTLINFTAVGFFGECEFWLSLIKVVCIIGFCLTAAAFLGVPGIQHRDVMDVLMHHGGILPHGIGALAAALPMVLFSMIGSEIATVAAAESQDAPRNLARVTRTIGARITLFYIASLTLILCIVPWTDIIPGHSPFVSAMETIGIPGAGSLMQIVVFSAVISCMNSSLFVSARTLWRLGQRHEAPGILRHMAEEGSAPRAAVIIAGLGGMGTAFSSILAPNTIFAFLLSATGAIMLFVYLLVVIAHLRMRRAAQKAGTPWQWTAIAFFPLANYLLIGAIAGVILSMLVSTDQRSTIISTCGTILLTWSFWAFVRHNSREPASSPSEEADL